MKFFVLFGLLLVQSVFSMPTGETFETKLEETKDATLTETVADTAVDAKSTSFLTDEKTFGETETELTRETRSYGYGDFEDRGGLAGFAYGGFPAGTYSGPNEPCVKKRHGGHGYGKHEGGHGGYGKHEGGHGGYGKHESHGGYGHESKGHGGYGHSHGGHGGYGHESKGHGGYGKHESHGGYGHSHGGHGGYGKHESHGYGKHESHGYGKHESHGGYGHESKGHGGYGHSHGGHGGYGHESKGHGGYGHSHGGHGYAPVSHGHGGYGKGHGGHGYKSSFEAEQADQSFDFVASPYGGHSEYGHAGGYVQPTHHQVHAYEAKAPHVQCGSNLLVGCNVHSAHVPCVASKGYGHHGGYEHAAPVAHYGGHNTYEAPKEKHHGYRADEEKEAPKEGENHRSEPHSLHLDPSSTNVSHGQTNNNSGAHPVSDVKRDETIAAMKKIMEKVANKEQSSNS